MFNHARLSSFAKAAAFRILACNINISPYHFSIPLQ
jgi:hypothetical protein